MNFTENFINNLFFALQSPKKCARPPTIFTSACQTKWVSVTGLADFLGQKLQQMCLGIHVTDVVNRRLYLAPSPIAILHIRDMVKHSSGNTSSPFDTIEEVWLQLWREYMHIVSLFFRSLLYSSFPLFFSSPPLSALSPSVSMGSGLAPPTANTELSSPLHVIKCI